LLHAFGTILICYWSESVVIPSDGRKLSSLLSGSDSRYGPSEQLLLDQRSLNEVFRAVVSFLLVSADGSNREKTWKTYHKKYHKEFSRRAHHQTSVNIHAKKKNSDKKGYRFTKKIPLTLTSFSYTCLLQ
jgi:hypothetical protein